MRIYSVHIRRHELDPDYEFTLIKEGFSWPALLFNIFWALWHRLWLVAVALFVIPLVLAIASNIIGLAPAGKAVLGLGWLVIVGMTGNDVRRYFLACNGFVDRGVADGKTMDDALCNHLQNSIFLSRNTRGSMP